MKGNPADILFINVSRIGDTLLATPAMRAVAAHWPEARLHVLSHPKREEVLRHLPFVYRTGRIEKRRANLMGWIPAKTYDLAFVCNFDEPLVRYALRVANRVVAFRQADDRLNARLFRAVDHPGPRSMHAVDIHLLLPAAMGISPAGFRLAYRITDGEANWAQHFLERQGVTGRRPLVGLQIASFPTKGYRDWPVENFYKLCGLIRRAHPEAHFLIFGGRLESRGRGLWLANQLGDAATLCAGRLSLRQTGALMGMLDLYIGVDTGPTHLMGALEGPMVALYHCYSPSWLLAPRERPRCHVIDHPLAGRCTPDASMEDIGVEQVWQAVAQVLNR